MSRRKSVSVSRHKSVSNTIGNYKYNYPVKKGQTSANLTRGLPVDQYIIQLRHQIEDNQDLKHPCLFGTIPRPQL